ncbi:MAG: hypothetical protein K8I60_00580, partial [Anaerolineae bacterium]|nr:hypothetical protein [Anaerolineae bacterium]
TPVPTLPPPSETPVPPSTETPVPTLPPPTQTPVPGELAVIAGVVEYQNAPDNAGITVQLVSAGVALAQLTTTETGAFQFTDVPAGDYQVVAGAPLHISILEAVSVAVDGLHVDIGTLILPAGDTDDSGHVDILDASWIGINFGGDAAAAPNADLNRDHQINVRDLALVGGNFDLQGPVTQQQ